ncbi:hypothetical protein [Streptomyces nigra]|uniref:hypothetical protein n=1 Tax=Streptomyces nigra TaxID=1827580 RepID=UPI00362826F4
MASTVYNQAALIASDVGATESARTMCHQHAVAYLHAAPLSGRTAIRALEPVINLARLHIRAGRADDGLQCLLRLFDAVTTGSPTQVEGVSIPAMLITDADDRQAVRAWLWSVLLADGTRALTTAGRWTEALAHVQAHRGIGQRMLDGRQVAVLAALVASDPDRAATLLGETAPSEPWEQAVAACLTALCRRAAGQPADRPANRLADIYVELEPELGTAVFDARLGLTILDLIGTSDELSTCRVVDELHRRAMKLNDGYATRAILTHPLFTALATDGQQKNCRAIVNACALGAGKLSEELRDQLTAALHTSDRTIRDCVTSTELSPTFQVPARSIDGA